MELFDLIVEELVDKGFDPSKHEAYAWCDKLMAKGRVRDYFQRKLDEIDWNKVEDSLRSFREDVGHDPRKDHIDDAGLESMNKKQLAKFLSDWNGRHYTESYLKKIHTADLREEVRKAFDSVDGFYKTEYYNLEDSANHK